MKLSVRKPLLSGLFCILSGLLFSTIAQAEVLRLSSPVPPSHIFSKVSEHFAENLKEKSDNRFNIKVFPYGKLGGDTENVQLMQQGAIHFAIIPAASISNRETSFNGWFLPGQFENFDKAGAATQLPAAREMLNNLESQGMVGLGYVIAGMRHVLSRAPVKSMSELKNQKIRVFPNSVFNDWWLANGASPTALPTSEVAPALTTNLLDAVDVDLDFVTSLKLYQQAPYFSLTNHMAFPGVVLASKTWWDKQNKDDKEMIRNVFLEAEQWGIKEQAHAEEKNLAKLRESGVEVFEIDAETFLDAATEVHQKYIDSNPLIAEFYQQVETNR